GHRASFDDLVSSGKQLRGEWELQHSRRLRVNDKLKLGRLHNWQVGGLCTLKNATAIKTDLSIRFGDVRSITDQSTDLGELTSRLHGWNTLMSRQLHQLHAPGV